MLLLITTYLTHQVIKSIKPVTWIKNIGYQVKDRYNNWQKEMKLQRLERLKIISRDKTFSIRLSLMERLEIFIDRSMIKNYIPFANGTVLIIVMIIIFGLSFMQILYMLHSYVSAFLLALICSAIPIVLLDALGRANTNKVREIIPDFLSILNSWLIVKEDLIYAMRNSVEDVPNPIGYYLKQCVLQIDRGMKPERALELMALKVNMKYFDKIIINISQTFISKGDVVELIGRLTNEAHQLHDEYQARNLSTAMDKLLLYFMLAMTLLIAYYILKINPEYIKFYSTIFGKITLNICTGLFFMCFVATLRLNQYKD